MSVWRRLTNVARGKVLTWQRGEPWGEPVQQPQANIPEPAPDPIEPPDTLPDDPEPPAPIKPRERRL